MKYLLVILIIINYNYPLITTYLIKIYYIKVLIDDKQLNWFKIILEKSSNEEDQELIKGFKTYIIDKNIVYYDGNN